MRNLSKQLRPLWIILTAVALCGAVAFAVLTAVAARAGKGSSPFPVELPAGVTVAAEGDLTVAAAGADNTISLFSKESGEVLWTAQRPISQEDARPSRIRDLAVRGDWVYAAFENREICRFAAEGGELLGVYAAAMPPQRLVFGGEGTSVLAVSCANQRGKEVVLLDTAFSGSLSYEDESVPRLNAANYAVGSGVNGIWIQSDQAIWIADETTMVTRFTKAGVAADGSGERETFTGLPGSLAAFCAVEDGFVGIDLKGDFYRMDDSFKVRSSASLGVGSLTSARQQGSSFYGLTSDGRLIGADADGLRFSISLNGAGLAMVSEAGFGLSDAGGFRYIGNDLAVQMASYGGKLALFAVLLAVFVLFLAYAALNVWRPLGQKVNHGFAVFGKALCKHRFAYLGLLPALLCWPSFYYWPILRGFALSFFDSNGATSTFVGFDNFAAVLRNTAFWRSTGNMFVLLATDLFKALVPPLLFAEFILAVRSKRFFLCGARPAVHSRHPARGGGDSGLGQRRLRPGFLRAAELRLFAVRARFYQVWIGPNLEASSLISIIMFAFPWVGSYLIFYGGVSAISNSLFEAADLDGCSWVRRMVTIDLPLIAPQLKYIFITSFIASVQDYGRLFITDQATGHGLKIPALIIYESLYGNSEPNYGLSSAMSMFLFAFLLIATVLNFRAQSKSD